MGFRVGDNAPMAFVELVDRPEPVETAEGRDRPKPADDADRGAHGMPEPLFRVAHLTKKFGDTTVVDDLSLEISAGRVPRRHRPQRRRQDDHDPHVPRPGRPRQRHIHAFGLPIPQQVREAKKRIGVVTQFDSLDPDFTCAENLRVYGPLLRPARRRSKSASRSCWSSRRCSPRPTPGRASFGRHEAPALAWAAR